MNKYEREVIENVIKSISLYKPLNPADVAGVVQHSHHCHYENEYLINILEGLLNGKNIDGDLECLEQNYQDFLQKCNERR